MPITRRCLFADRHLQRPFAGSITGSVVGIADGDTITILDADHHQHKIRLAGIDAPEKRQDFGQRSKQSLSDLAYRQQATVETGKTDRYGRSVGNVLVNDHAARNPAAIYR